MQPPVSDVPTNKTRRTLSWPVIVLLFIALPYIGGYIGYKKGLLKAPVQRVVVDPLPLHPDPDPEPAAEVSVTDTLTTSENFIETPWYQYRNTELGLGIFIPNGYTVTETAESVRVSKGSDLVRYDEEGAYGFTIHTRDQVTDFDDVVAYAKEIYGPDCEVEISRDEESGVYTDEYHVAPPDSTAAIECDAIKATLIHVPFYEQVATWNAGMDVSMPSDSPDSTLYYDSIFQYNVTIIRRSGSD